MVMPTINETVSKTFIVELNGDQILEMLRRLTGWDLPSDAAVTFEDWSGKRIEIDDDDPIRVTWRSVQEKAY